MINFEAFYWSNDKKNFLSVCFSLTCILYTIVISLDLDNASLLGLQITLPHLMCVECIIYYLLFYVIRLMLSVSRSSLYAVGWGVMTFCGSGFCALALSLNSTGVQTSHPNAFVWFIALKTWWVREVWLSFFLLSSFCCDSQQQQQWRGLRRSR